MPGITPVLIPIAVQIELEHAAVKRSRPRGAVAGLLLLLTMLAALLLVACGGTGSALSGVTASTDRIVPGSSGLGKPPGVVEVRYSLGSKEQVTVMLGGPETSTLLAEEQGPGEHVVRFSGLVADNRHEDGYEVVRRLVQPGDYTISISAGGMQESVAFKIDAPAEGSATPPVIENFVVKPDTISPNSDAVADVSEITFRTNETATLRVDLASINGTATLAFAPQEKGPGEQSVVVNGQDLAGNPLPDGTYTVTVQAADSLGNLTQVQHSLKIQNSGQPSIQILKVEFSPQQITLGSTIGVSITVVNNGKVPLRTQGPDPGYTYTTNDSYSSIEGGKWDNKAGLWRVGVDWDGNSGGGPYRYPFRWALKPGADTLMPGEKVVTGGKITILKQEQTMWFYAGVLQEGIRIFLDRLGRTAIHISY